MIGNTLQSMTEYMIFEKLLLHLLQQSKQPWNVWKYNAELMVTAKLSMSSVSSTLVVVYSVLFLLVLQISSIYKSQHLSLFR